jgi:hypothetical protein
MEPGSSSTVPADQAAPPERAASPEDDHTDEDEGPHIHITFPPESFGERWIFWPEATVRDVFDRLWGVFEQYDVGLYSLSAAMFTGPLSSL